MVGAYPKRRGRGDAGDREIYPGYRLSSPQHTKNEVDRNRPTSLLL